MHCAVVNCSACDTLAGMISAFVLPRAAPHFCLFEERDGVRHFAKGRVQVEFIVIGLLPFGPLGSRFLGAQRNHSLGDVLFCKAKIPDKTVFA